MPNLIMLIGLPASGKTTWREQRLVNSVEPLPVVISQDDLVEAYAKQHGLTYTEAFAKADLKAFERQVKQDFAQAIAENRSVILDRTNLSIKSRRAFRAMVPAHYTRIAVAFEIDPLVQEDRLDRRAAATGKMIPMRVIRQMRASYQRPSHEEGFDVIEYVRGPEPGWSLRMRWFCRVIRRKVARLFKSEDK